ncbi:MAG: fibronectin type III domain-containing protein, partial [Planctomycetota bacterium]
EPGRAGEIVLTAELDDRTPDQRADIALFKIDYGTTTAYGQTVPYLDWPEPNNTRQVRGRRYRYTRRFRHTITGLRPDTTYHLRVTARDPYGNVGASGDVTARTSGARQSGAR